jgi:hypothetical protein
MAILLLRGKIDDRFHKWIALPLYKLLKYIAAYIIKERVRDFLPNTL